MTSLWRRIKFDYQKDVVFDVFLLLVGSLINSISYMSFSPIFVAAIFYIMLYIILKYTSLGGDSERRMFRRVFGVSYIVSGVAAIYANQFNDYYQIYSDAGGFFELASGNASALSLDKLKSISEGSLAIVVWGFIYEMFNAIGFEKNRYIGITANMTAVALSGVVGIKIIRKVFGDDEYRFRRLINLVAGCGLFWLFACIHLRDSLVLLAITAFTYTWVRFLAQPKLSYRLLLLCFWSIIAEVVFSFLRTEFVFVPFATAVCAIVSLVIGRRGQQKFVINSIIIVCGIALVIMAVNYSSEIMAMVDNGKKGYIDKSVSQEGPDSLGLTLIVNQPLPIRLVFGSIYLFVFPIPFWSGFQLNSAYALLKSLNVIYFYFLMPRLYMAIQQFINQKNIRSPLLIFLFLFTLLFVFTIATTSLETRHFGAFLIPVFVIAVLPDLRITKARKQYLNYLRYMLIMVACIHIIWIILKMY